MIELKNLSAKPITSQYYNEQAQLIISKIVIQYHIISIQDLLDNKDKFPQDIWRLFSQKLRTIERYTALNNKSGREPTIFLAKKYEDDFLAYNDDINYGDVLLLANPTIEFPINYIRLNSLSIATIKEDLSLCISSGKNYLAHTIKGIGIARIPRVLQAVDMYTEQVVRQAHLYPLRDKNVNLFTIDQDTKIKRVEEYYDQIIDYLIETNTDDFLWYDLTSPQIDLYKAVGKKRGDIIRRRMIIMIANYTTLEELENIANGHYEPLTRFKTRERVPR